MGETFGEAMRRLRGQVSLRELARRAHIDPGHLSRIEAGRRPPTPEVAAAIDTALCAGGELATLAEASGTPWPVDSGVWLRRHAERLAAALVDEEPTRDNAVRLAHDWLIAEPPQMYELRAGRRIGPGTVARIARRVQQLRRLDDHAGGGQTHALVLAELSATADLLRGAAYTETVGRLLLVAVAELCQLAGWVAADIGRYGEARRLYLAGVRAGHAGGDEAGAANNLSSLAYLAANVGDPREAAVLARSAYAGARRAATAVTRALLLERVAWSHARADEAAAAERALGQVDDVFASRGPADDPPWVYWLTVDEVAIMAGRVWTELRRPLRAVPILERATAEYGEDTGRETALYLTWLAEALVQARELEQAANVATRALRLARRSDSPRAVGRVEVVRRQLAAFAGTPAVDAFEDECRAHL
jgi:transcriptional regulator with XRE-family HTH domain